MSSPPIRRPGSVVIAGAAQKQTLLKKSNLNFSKSLARVDSQRHRNRSTLMDTRFVPST
jgi:hypothetical protein